jgi:Eukaryotic DNA topoisomerase I, catalytic core
VEVYKLTASQLTSLLQILGALVADYVSNPKRPMAAGLRPYVKTVKQWQALPSLPEAVEAAIKGGDKLSALFAVGTELKAVFPEFKQNRAYTTPELRMLNALRSYLSTDSELALNFIRQNASVFGSPELAAIFAPPIPKADSAALKRTVKALVGRDGTHLTRTESEMLKETNPKEYALYVEHRKAHNAEFKATLTNLIRKSGKDKADYGSTYKQIVGQGFTHSMVPGFDGLIDDKGNWYTKNGELIGGVPNLSTYTHVAMNDGKDPEASWVFKAYKVDGDSAYFYTTNFRRSQSSAKYEHVAELMTNIGSIQNAWRQKIKKWNPADKLCVSAVVLEILYTYAARIGSAPGRGAGTLLVKNASVTQAGVNLAYIGKDSIPIKHIIRKADSPEHALLVKRLIELIGDKKPSMWLYTINVNGRLMRVTPADVNKAFHTFGAPETVTVHKLRTCRGTTLFKQLIDKDAETRRPPSTEKDALERYKAMTAKVGELLNHKRGVGTEKESVTGTTAALSYIDGDLQAELWARWGFRPPSFLEKLLRDDS